MDYSISDDSESSELDRSYQERSSNGFPLCRGCNKEIFNQYYLRVNEMSWHDECLKCNLCNLTLVSEETCFFKKSKIFCKIDYYKNFGIKCAKCARNIQSSDWVRRAKDNVYHLACFACEACKRQLSTGEEFALQNNKVLCKTHYCESIDGDSSEKEDNSKSKNKRVRTTFTEEQLQVLQANFEVDSNPDGQDLERIAQITGLSKRVTQVWFQNSRARQKKYKEKKIDLNSTLDMNENSNENLWSSSDSPVYNKKVRSHATACINNTSFHLNNNNFPNNFNDNSSINDIKSLKKNKKFKLKPRNETINRDDEENLSCASDESVSDDENTIFDTSLDYNQGID